MEIKDMQKEVDNWISQFAEGYWHPLTFLPPIKTVHVID